MILHDKIWRIKTPSSDIVKKFIVKLGLSSVIAKLLVNRGIDTIEKAMYFIKDRDNSRDNSQSKNDDNIVVNIDCQLDIKDITFDLIEEMEKLGLDNPKPKFIYKDIIIKKVSSVENTDNILKLLIQDDSRVYDCVGYDLGKYADNLVKNDRADIVFTLEKNNFKGIETIQLNLIDIRLKSGRIYIDKEIVQNYLLSFGEAIIDLVNIELWENKKKVNIKDLRNFKNRNNIIIKSLDSHERTLILVHTLEGLIDLIFFFEEIGREDLIEFISFNNINSNKENLIVVNPIFKNMDIKDYKNIIFYDSPLNEYILKHNLFIGKKITVLYNEMDIRNLEDFFEIALPNRHNLVDVYKYIRAYNSKQISLIQLDKNSKVQNLAKLKLCIYLLKKIELINFTQENNSIYNIDILPIPKEKIDITDTNVYKKIQFIRHQYKEFKELAFGESLLLDKEN